MKKRSDKMDIENVLLLIKHRPEIYIGAVNIHALELFLSGFLFNNLSNDRKYFIDICFRDRIHDWIKKEIEKRKNIQFELNVGYDYYIEAVCDNGEQEVALFFELCEEFFEEMKNKNQ